MKLYESCPHCGGFHPAADAVSADDFESEALRIARGIYEGESNTYDPGLLSRTIESLQAQVINGYGKDFPGIAYDSPDFEMLNHLTQNTYEFSAAKNWQQLKDMTMALREGDQLRTEAEYMRAVEAMNLKYNRDWLVTERNTAIAGGQMASRWVEFEKDKDIMPMLEYSTVGDGNVRASHAALDGVRKPVDDPFWSSYYPPNGWNCRCDVIAVADERAVATRDGSFTVPEVSRLFKTNLAKEGLVFPKGHPYYTGIPKPELRKAISYLPPENSYHAVKGKNRGKIDFHILHNESELQGNLKVADDLVKLGYKDIKLLPDFHEKESHLRKKFLPEGYKQKNLKKNPDACLTKDGREMVCDFKVLSGERNFSHRIAQAAEQAEYAVIKLGFEPEKLGLNSIKRSVSAQMDEHSNLKGVIVLKKDGDLLYEYYRKS